jgi:succinate dehydrogenase/fumarate reductase cytochrome b subunit
LLSYGACARAIWIGNFVETGKGKIMSLGYNSLLGVLILVADIWAIINIFQSSVSNEKKLIWIIVVVLLPVLGLILWFFLGPRDRKS